MGREHGQEGVSGGRSDYEGKDVTYAHVSEVGPVHGSNSESS